MLSLIHLIHGTHPCLINQELKNEFDFWLRNLNNLNGYPIKTCNVSSKIVYSDASDTGYGGYVVQKLGDLLATGKFSPQESATSSTSRELLAVRYILQSFGLQLQNENVQWFSDNMNVARIMKLAALKHIYKRSL